MKCPCIWFFCSSGGNRTCESSHDRHTIWLRLWLSAPEIVPFRCETGVIGNAHAHGGHADIGKYVRQQGNIIGLAIFIAQCFRIYLCKCSGTSPYGHLTSKKTSQLQSPWLSPKLYSRVQITPCNKVTSPLRSLLPSPVVDLNSEVLLCIQISTHIGLHCIGIYIIILANDSTQE